MQNFLKTALAATCCVMAGQAIAQITFHEHENFSGRSFSTQRQVANFERFGFNDRASSVVVERGRWEVCQDARFEGSCKVLRPGSYPSLSTLGLNNRISSVRAVNRRAEYSDDRYAPEPPQAAYDPRRRNNERLYQANVTSVRAVVGPPEQRCWTEQDGSSPERGRTNVPGAVLGAVIGGILGHQVGGGSGRDIATVGGVVAGAAVGGNVNRGTNPRGPDVQRCENVASTAGPQYWDVTYRFRGQEHHMQTTSRPGPTVSVNRNGEPRA